MRLSALRFPFMPEANLLREEKIRRLVVVSKTRMRTHRETGISFLPLPLTPTLSRKREREKWGSAQPRKQMGHANCVDFSAMRTLVGQCASRRSASLYLPEASLLREEKNLRLWW